MWYEIGCTIITIFVDWLVVGVSLICYSVLLSATKGSEDITSEIDNTLVLLFATLLIQV